MSVVFVVVPGVVMGWGTMCGVIAAAAGAIGYRSARTKAQHTQFEAVDIAPRVDIAIAQSSILPESMAEGDEFTLTRDDVTATFSRKADGQCVVHVTGEGKSNEELTQLGQELIARVTQQYAYHKVVTEMKKQGFTVSSEEVSDDNTIRIRVSKYQ